MKKLVSLVLALSMMLLCSGAMADALTENGTYPISDEKITLTVFAPQISTIIDLATNDFTLWMEEKTNIHIEWVTAPEANVMEVLSLTLADDIPDIILGCGLKPQYEELYCVAEGLFLPLNDLIDEYAPNFSALLEKRPEIRDVITATDGNIYALPSVQDCYHCQYCQKMWINQEWLDVLDLEMPTTTDEFYEVLKAFRDGDPNGNGIQDEIPLIGCIERDGWYQSVTGFILNAFIYDPGVYVPVKDYVTKDGIIDTGVNKEEYREGLRYLNKLYSEGLIYTDSFTMNYDNVKSLALAEEELVGASPAGHLAMFLDVATNPERYRHYTSIEPLEGPTGLKQATYFPYYPVATGEFIITVENEYPEASMRWADAFYDYTVQMWRNWGKEGEAWRVAEEGEVGLDGVTPALFKTLIPFDEQAQNEHWSWLGIEYCDNELWNGYNVTTPDMDLYSAEGFEKLLWTETETKYEPYRATEYSEIPPLRLEMTANDELVLWEVQLENYIDSCRANFVTGDLSLDDDWDTYLAELENLGLSRYLELKQEAYDNVFKED